MTQKGNLGERQEKNRENVGQSGMLYPNAKLSFERKNSKRFISVMLILSFLALFISGRLQIAVYGAKEFQITADLSNQKAPAIYGDVVVWEDYRNGNWDIYGYDLSTETEFQITTHPSDQYDPAIFGNAVVWEDYRSRSVHSTRKNSDIYGYDLSTKTEFQITVNEYDQRSPDIYGSIVVWDDGRNGNIFGYDLSTKREFQITKDTLSRESCPRIYEDIVVWSENRDDLINIYGCDLSTNDQFFISRSRSGFSCAAVYGDIVVWEASYIYCYNLSSGKRFRITDSGAVPDIYENIVVWSDDRNGNCDIYGYDLSTETEFQITTHPSDQTSPAIYGNVVVWVDYRNGNADIYCTRIDLKSLISTSPSSPSPSSPSPSSPSPSSPSPSSPSPSSPSLPISIAVEIWDFLTQYKFPIAFTVYLLEVAYNIRAYRDARKKGLTVPRGKLILLILGSFPLFIDFFKPRRP